MFNKIFSLPNSARQSFADSSNDFKIVATTAKDFVSHSSAAVSAIPELGKQIGTSILGGGVAVIAGAGLCVASAVFFPAFVAPVTSALGWGVFTHPFSVVATAITTSLIYDSANLKTFSINSFGAVKDAVSIPYHAVKGVGEAVIGSGKVVYNVANETLITLRAPDQEATDNKDGKHIQVIGDSWFKSSLKAALSTEDCTEIKDNFVELKNAPTANIQQELSNKDLAIYFASPAAQLPELDDAQLTMTGEAVEVVAAMAA